MIHNLKIMTKKIKTIKSQKNWGKQFFINKKNKTKVITKIQINNQKLNNLNKIKKYQISKKLPSNNPLIKDNKISNKVNKFIINLNKIINKIQSKRLKL